MDQPSEELLKKGVAALEAGNTLMALVYLEELAEKDARPVVLSYLGYCIAKERGQLKKGIQMVSDAMKAEPQSAVHYLNMGRLSLLAGKRKTAIEAFRQGLKLEALPPLVSELKRLGLRAKPVFSSLPRENPLNKALGLVLKKLHLK